MFQPFLSSKDNRSPLVYLKGKNFLFAKIKATALPDYLKIFKVLFLYLNPKIIMALSPASLGIILNSSQTHLLLVQRQDVPIWVLPGGGIELDETPEQAAIREIQEETGYLVKIQRQTAHYLPANSLTSVTFVFLCQIVGGTPVLSLETKDCQFFPLTHLPSPLFPPHRKWIEEGLSHSELICRPLTEVSYTQFFKMCFFHPLWILCYLITRLTKK